MNKIINLAALVLFLVTRLTYANAAEFSLVRTEQFLQKLAPHALRYPTSFDSKSQYNQYSKILKEVLLELDSALPNSQTNAEFLFQYALANSMGHNMDISGCAEKSIAGYSQLLEINPDDKRANYYFGSFLSATTLYEKSFPYLQRAIELGEQDAHYTLGFVYIKEGKTQAALAEFKDYLEVNPENQAAKKMVKDIENNSLKVDVKSLPLQN